MDSMNAVFDKYFNVISGNSDFFEFIGARTFKSFFKFIGEEDAEKIQKLAEDAQIGEFYYEIVTVKDTNDEPCTLHMRMKKELPQENNPLYHVDFMRLPDLYDNLEYTKTRFSILKGLLSTLDITALVYDDKIKKIAVYNPGTVTPIILHYQPLDVWQKNMINNEKIKPCDIKAFNDLCGCIRNFDSSFTYELENKIYTDKYIKSLVRGTSLIMNKSERYVVCTFTNALNEEVIYEKDTMTGLLDKNSTIRYITDSINNPEIKSVTMAIIDIDNFKDINDNLGHAAGDKVIIKFGELLSSVVGSKGVLGRFGGDEFIAVFINQAEEMKNRAILRAIRSTTEQTFKDIEGFSLTCSIGCASYPDNAGSYDELFKIADGCVYLAKEYGKNRYVIYTPEVHKNIDFSVSHKVEKQRRKLNDSDFNKYVTQILFSGGISSLQNILKLIYNYFKLSSVKVFVGSNMELEYSYEEASEKLSGKYIFSKNYIESFKDNQIFINDFSGIEERFPEVYKEIKQYGSAMIVQNLMVVNQEIIGFISFESDRSGRRCFKDSELNIFTMLTNCIAQEIYKTLK